MKETTQAYRTRSSVKDPLFGFIEKTLGTCFGPKQPKRFRGKKPDLAFKILNWFPGGEWDRPLVKVLHFTSVYYFYKIPRKSLLKGISTCLL